MIKFPPLYRINLKCRKSHVLRKFKDGTGMYGDFEMFHTNVVVRELTSLEYKLFFILITKCKTPKYKIYFYFHYIFPTYILLYKMYDVCFDVLMFLKTCYFEM